MGRKFGFSFSWKRAFGISGTKASISRKIGIPLTRQGRQRKFGQMAGCCIVLFFLIISMIFCAVAIASVIKRF